MKTSLSIRSVSQILGFCACLSLSPAAVEAANVTIPGLRLPNITSYAPPYATAGAKVYANIEYPQFSNSKPVTPTGVEFLRSDGRRVAVAAVAETSGLISFVLPSNAVTCRPALLGPSGMRLEEQLEFRVVSLTQTPRGVTLINRTQYVVGSVSTSGRELLPSDSTIDQTRARFFSLSMTSTPTALKLQMQRRTASNALIPMMELQETVGGAFPGTQVPVIYTVLDLERLTVAEMLGAGNGSSEWTLHHRGQNRRMMVQYNGTVTLEERVSGTVQVQRYMLKEVSWSNNSPNVQFALVDSSGNLGETVVLHPPFQTFAAMKFGQFSYEDVPPTLLSSGSGEPGAVTTPVPLFMVRVR
ncbi:hypothetical protein SAMN02745166_03345 [Prosthecobacter debontii]|uniref:Uncharacterized protein n=1 Tax=Prosthecobacter debontii TaxID=48467 RepID=A0A1T4YI88_9BACT|nr:hypothetical protein [Prosthecobacter debontii]SKB01248.1 hypothetical protein SAMN02745166_03345 [Prosthecobacter debontii]